MANPLDRLADLIGDKDPVPNKLTIAMGKLIRQAREDAGLSQARLATSIYRRRATISDIENGKSELTVSTLALIAAALDKPISYFFPWFVYENLSPDELSPNEHEALKLFRRIRSEGLEQLAIRQLRQIANTDPSDVRNDKDPLLAKLSKLFADD